MAGDQLRTVSTVEAAAEAIRERILDGTLAMGERLREVQYAEELGIARHSFRAATAALIHEGLLVRAPNRGVEVPVLGAEDILDIFRLRAALEVEAIRLVLGDAEGRPATLEDLAAAVDELSALGDDAPWRMVVDGDARFHRALIDATGSPRLLRAYLAAQSEILLCLVQQRPLYYRPEEIAAEHRDLLAALESGDPDESERRFRAHLDEAAERLIEWLAGRDGGERGA